MPQAGYGGSEIIVAPDERHIALFVYSGQSQVGYELFALDVTTATVKQVGRMPYIHGHGDAPRFSPDGRWLALLATCTPQVRTTGEYLEEALDPEADEGDEIVADLGRLLFQPVPGEIAEVAVGVRMARSADYDAVCDEWQLYEALSFG